jgi:hypothetical protein
LVKVSTSSRPGDRKVGGLRRFWNWSQVSPELIARVPPGGWDLADPTIWHSSGAGRRGLQELAQSELGRARVIDDGRLAGLLSLTDLARAAQLGPPRRARAT